MSINSRLNSLAPDLVEFGSGITRDQRRTIALHVAEWACRKSNAVAYMSDERLHWLLSGDALAAEKGRIGLQNDVDALDEKYFQLQDEGGEAANVESLEWFSKARAVASLTFLAEADSEKGFCDVLYEALAATDDLSGLRLVCRSHEERNVER